MFSEENPSSLDAKGFGIAKVTHECVSVLVNDRGDAYASKLTVHKLVLPWSTTFPILNKHVRNKYYVFSSSVCSGFLIGCTLLRDHPETVCVVGFDELLNSLVTNNQYTLM